MEKRSIAIDGPAGAGKSTLSNMLAAHFGLIYVDTGAIYRSVGLHAYNEGIDPKDGDKVSLLLPDIKIEMMYDGGIQRMILNGRDVTSDIRMPAISVYASDVSAIPCVRSFLLDMQRKMAQDYDVIMDGRDIGTVVLPNAGLKLFLSATPEDRARRRYEELVAKGVDTTYSDVLRDINYRDKNDSTRATSPLKPARDALLLDTTGNSLQESFDILKKIVEAHLKRQE